MFGPFNLYGKKVFVHNIDNKSFADEFRNL